MDDPALADLIRRVEQTPLRDLVSVDIEEVQVHMDQLIRPDVDSASLYRRWEQQHWAVSDLDFSQDVQHWQMLEPGIRQIIQATMTLFFLGEQAVTDTLSPLLHASPREDERIFLSTQVADEARHTVFFQRFFDEVLGVSGGIHAALATLRPSARDGYRRVFDGQLTAATDRVRREPENQRAWVEGVVTYHLVIEGFLALTGQRALLRVFRNIGLMPGFTAGFTAVARDESRHIGFGVLALRRRVDEDAENARVIARKVLELLEPAVMTIVGPDEPLPYEDPAAVPEPMRLNPLDIREWAVDSLDKRLRACGLASATVDGIAVEARTLYEKAWDRYESLQGRRHPVRFFRSEAAAAAD
jgi:ribonucleoside-diphosphate reductase beta chain